MTTLLSDSLPADGYQHLWANITDPSLSDRVLRLEFISLIHERTRDDPERMWIPPRRPLITINRDENTVSAQVPFIYKSQQIKERHDEHKTIQRVRQNERVEVTV